MAKSKLTQVISSGTDTEVILAGNVTADDASSDVGVAGGAVIGDAAVCGMVSQFIVGDGESTSAIVFATSTSSFPALGSSTSLYIDMGDEVIYRWNEDTSEYKVIGEDLSNITRIIVGTVPGFSSGTLTALQILLHSHTATEWTTENPTLVDGEIGIEKGTCQFKIGDGAHKWNELDYIGSIPDDYVTNTDYATGIEGGVVLSSTAINTIAVDIDGTMTINTIGGDKIVSTLSTDVIPDLSWNKIKSDKPSTLAGYGIEDATPSSHVGSGGTEHATATEFESGFIASYSQKKLNDIEAGAEVNVIEVVKKNGSALPIVDKAVDIVVPTKTSEIANDSNFPVDASYVHTDNNYTTDEKTKLTGVEAGAEVNVIEVIKKNGSTLSITDKAVNIVVPTKTSEIANDSNFPVDASYVHTDNNYTTDDKTKLAGIAAGAEVNVNTDWNATTGDAQLLNKPTTISGYGITDAYTKTEVDSKLSSVYRFKGSVATYADLPTAGLTAGDIYNVIETDMNYGWTGTGWDPLGKTYDLASLTANGLMSKGDYAKLANIAAGAEVNVIEVVKKNGSTLSVTDKVVDIIVPTKTSEIANDSNFPADASYVHTDNNYTTDEKTKLTGIEAGAEVNNMSDSDVTDLTDGTDSTLHFHSTDRDRSNHTGTQAAATISDLSSAIKNMISYTGTCATAIATVAKTVVLNEDASHIATTNTFYAIKFTSGNNALACTLAINGGTAYPMRLNGAAVNAVDFGLAAGALILFFFDGTYFHIMGSQRTTDSDTDTWNRIQWDVSIIAGATIYSYKTLMQAADGKFYPLSLENGAGNKTASTQQFLLSSPILYYNSSTSIAAAASTASNLFTEMNHSYLGNTACATSWTAYLPIYLRGIVDASGYFVLDNSSYTSWVTQTLPTSEDGYVYIMLGYMYGTTNMRMFAYHPIYEYKNGKLRLYTDDSSINTTNIEAILNSGSEKTTPVDADKLIIMDSEASNIQRKFSVANLKTFLASIFQPLLVSGTNIKTINNTSVLGEGNIEIAGSGGDMTKAIYDANDNGIVDKAEALYTSAYAAGETLIANDLVILASDGKWHKCVTVGVTFTMYSEVGSCLSACAIDSFPTVQTRGKVTLPTSGLGTINSGSELFMLFTYSQGVCTTTGAVNCDCSDTAISLKLGMITGDVTKVNLDGNRFVYTFDSNYGVTSINGYSINASQVDGLYQDALLSRANHTGTQLASTISDFASAALSAAPQETAASIGTIINGASEKTAIADNDLFVIADSADTAVAKKSTFANLKTLLGEIFAAKSHTQAASTITDLKSNVIYTGTIATAAGSQAKTVTLNEDATHVPTSGECYAFVFTLGNTVGSSTVSINGGSAIPFKLNGIAATTITFTLNATSTVLAYYDGSNMNIMGSQRTSDTDTDTHDRIAWVNNTITAGVDIIQYKIIMEAADGKFYPLTLEGGTGATKTVSTQPFPVDAPILFWNVYSTTTAGSTIQNNLYSEISSSYLAYTANAASFTSQQLIYMKGTINSSGHFVLDNTSYTSWLTQTLPTSDDSFVYKLLGYMYSSSEFRLLQNHPVYQYKDGKIVPYSGAQPTTTTMGALIAGSGAKTSLVDADIFIVADSEASNLAKHSTLANLKTALNGALSPASHAHSTDDITGFAAAALSAAPAETATTIGALISGATSKTTPVSADALVISDSTDSSKAKQVLYSNFVSAMGSSLATTMQQNARITTLTGLSVATTTDVTSTDSVLSGIGKLQGQLNLTMPISVQSTTPSSVTDGYIIGVFE